MIENKLAAFQYKKGPNSEDGCLYCLLSLYAETLKDSMYSMPWWQTGPKVYASDKRY